MGGPSVQHDFFPYEAFDLISCTTIIGVSYGIALKLYCLCACSLYLQLREPDTGRQAKFTLGFISLLLFCTAIILALNSRVIQLAYVNHADFPGGPLEYEDSYTPTIKIYGAVGSTIDLVVEVLTMAIQVSQWLKILVTMSLDTPSQYLDLATVDNMRKNKICCSSHHLACTPPFSYRFVSIIYQWLLYLIHTYLALDVPSDIIGNIVPYSQLGISEHTSMVIETARYAVLSGLTVIVTGLIALRLLLVRRRHVKIMGKCSW